MDPATAAGIVAILGAIGTLIARWSEANPNKPWYVRLARVFDATQVVDSTRRLGDE
jgi:hypothetical protein|tara:strand:+ start:34 stop:201 length:168 start_codon:yes stop_codon:yes gene_type:complete